MDKFHRRLLFPNTLKPFPALVRILFSPRFETGKFHWQNRRVRDTLAALQNMTDRRAAIPDDASSLEFPSLAFPKGRAVLTVNEVAARWQVTVQHVLNLLEEGALAGFDISGRQKFMRVPEAAVPALASRFKVKPEVILQIIRSVEPGPKMSRSHWRVPVEGYAGFMRKNHSLVKL